MRLVRRIENSVHISGQNYLEISLSCADRGGDAIEEMGLEVGSLFAFHVTKLDCRLSKWISSSTS